MKQSKSISVLSLCHRGRSQGKAQVPQNHKFQATRFVHVVEDFNICFFYVGLVASKKSLLAKYQEVTSQNHVEKY